MQTLTVDFIMSLDGSAAAEGWPGWWGMEGPEYLAWLEDSPEKDHPIVMGATTYRLMSGMPRASQEGTDVLGGMPKAVFSSTLTSVDWANTSLLRTDAVEGVRELLERRLFDGKLQLLEYAPTVLDVPPLATG